MSSIRVFDWGGSPPWAIKASYYSQALVEAAKAVPGVHFDRTQMAWVGYADAVAAVIARLALKGIRVEGDLPDPDAWRTARPPFTYATAGLRDYQLEGVRFLLIKAGEGALLADSMRLGKSCVATTAARAWKAKTLIACPSLAVGVWGREPKAIEGPGEIAKWWPDAWRAPSEVICLETVKPARATTDEIAGYVEKLAHAQVIVCHYEILYAWAEVLLAWGVETFICDEIHLMSGWQSRRLDVLKKIARAAKRRIGLSGTPVVNQPRNLHNVLNILSENRLGFFFLPDKKQDDGTMVQRASYSRLFCGARQETIGKGEHAKTVWKFDGRGNLDVPDGEWALTKEETLKERMRYLMLRRVKKDVDPQLPEKQRKIIDVSVPTKAAIRIGTGILGAGGKDLRRALDLAADGKLKTVVDVVRGHIDEEEKCVCFCYRRLFAERVASDVRKKVTEKAFVAFVHGVQLQKERDRIIHMFRQHSGAGVLVCTIDTTSASIDLSCASVAVFAELSWQHEDLAQCEERLYKFSGAKSLIEYIIARGTGDELILRGVINKLDTSEKLIGGTGDAMKEDLEAKRGDALKRLAGALAEMQKALPPLGGRGVNKQAGRTSKG